MYDDTCRFLAEHFSADFASWLLGKPVTMTELKPSELSLDPIRADALILLESDESVRAYRVPNTSQEKYSIPCFGLPRANVSQRSK
jgi:predicted transposase YdaD